MSVRRHLMMDDWAAYLDQKGLAKHSLRPGS